MNRREFLKTGAAAAAGGIAAAAGPLRGSAGPRTAGTGMPMIKLGSLQVSRLILGSNPFYGYSHKSAQVDAEMRLYYTDEKIMQILDEAAECGLTVVASPPEERWIKIWDEYRAKSGRLKHWLSQCDRGPEYMVTDIDRSIRAGAASVFIQGARVEDQFKEGRFDVLRSWIDRIKDAGLPAGAAAHWPEVHPELQKRGFPLDFYYQCLYNVSKAESYAPAEREKAVATIAVLEKPVIAYKILAAGRVSASEGFEYAFNHIKPKDGVCVGIFARNAIDQIRQNSTYTEMLSTA
jgi:hypothetical protein